MHDFLINPVDTTAQIRETYRLQTDVDRQTDGYRQKYPVLLMASS